MVVRGQDGIKDDTYIDKTEVYTAMEERGLVWLLAASEIETCQFCESAAEWKLFLYPLPEIYYFWNVKEWSCTQLSIYEKKNTKSKQDFSKCHLILNI